MIHFIYESIFTIFFIFKHLLEKLNFHILLFKIILK